MGATASRPFHEITKGLAGEGRGSRNVGKNGRHLKRGRRLRLF